MQALIKFVQLSATKLSSDRQFHSPMSFFQHFLKAEVSILFDFSLTKFLVFLPIYL